VGVGKNVRTELKEEKGARKAKLSRRASRKRASRRIYPTERERGELCSAELGSRGNRGNYILTTEKKTGIGESEI